VHAWLIGTESAKYGPGIYEILRKTTKILLRIYGSLAEI